MIEAPQIVQTTAQTIAVIHLIVPSAEIQKHMGPGITELRAAVAAQGIAVTGPWFTHHFHNPNHEFNFEIGLPVASPVTAAGRMKPGVWPSMRVLRTVYHGGYENLGAGWGEFEAWITAQGHQGAKDLWEVYSVGPESGPDSANYRTQLNRPLAA